MKALILAAGYGSRLAPLTNEIPKCLIKVNDTPIIFKQIDNLLENNITDITVISGYRANVLQSVITDKYPSVHIIENKDYDKTNNMCSAYLGLKSIDIDDYIIMMNADVFYDSSIIKELIKNKYENAIVVDIGNYNEESMKVIKKHNRLIEISKTIEEEKALGNSIDVYKFNKDGAKAFLDKCHDYIYIRKELNKWSEVALNDILEEIIFKSCPLNGRWFEIDTIEDLQKAEELFK